jgi:hypothetical protein
MGWVCGYRLSFSEPKRTGMDSFHQHKQERPHCPHKKVYAHRSTDGVSRHGPIAQHRSEDDHSDKGKEEGAKTFADEQQQMASADIYCPPEGKYGKAEYSGGEGDHPIVAERIDVRKEDHGHKDGEGRTRQRMVGQKRLEKKKQDKRNEQRGKPASEEANGGQEESVVTHATSAWVLGVSV